MMTWICLNDIQSIYNHKTNVLMASLCVNGSKYQSLILSQFILRNKT